MERGSDELLNDGVQNFADDFDTLLPAVAQRRSAPMQGSSFEIAAGSPEMDVALVCERAVWRAQGKYDASSPPTNVPTLAERR